MSGPWSNQAVSLIILTEQTTGFSGLFGYSPTVGAGNLIFSLAAKAGTDPYGNAYPQGLSTTLGAISGTTFTGSDFIINDSGSFFYSGTPAVNNLIASIAGARGTDPFGNTYYEGVCSYTPSGSGGIASLISQLDQGNVLIGSNAEFSGGQPAIFSHLEDGEDNLQGSGAGGGDVFPSLTFASQYVSGIPGGAIYVNAGTLVQ